jgi:hypothetical protein
MSPHVGVFDGEAAMSLRSVPVCIRAAEDAMHPDRGQKNDRPISDAALVPPFGLRGVPLSGLDESAPNLRLEP